MREPTSTHEADDSLLHGMPEEKPDILPPRTCTVSPRAVGDPRRRRREGGRREGGRERRRRRRSRRRREDGSPKPFGETLQRRAACRPLEGEAFSWKVPHQTLQGRAPLGGQEKRGGGASGVRGAKGAAKPERGHGPDQYSRTPLVLAPLLDRGQAPRSKCP
ncbi:unnamed protein product [Prorocentrum cordatum]|uniref:Uncharacterized protein n=1 Tax=Prorocentrum cordatum TaxID=2364126 RepID=A0ABN9QMX9_9DINO|nr:unnamed protein product [Polarella glacialis]